MSPRRLLATARRVLTQVANDRRTIALVLIVPIVLETLLRLIYNDNRSVFNSVGLPMLGIFPLVMMFLIASISTLRERTRGTLERLMVMPLSKAEFILGYSLAFSVVAIVQAVLVSLVALGPLGLQAAGSHWLIIFVAAINGLLGMSMGLFVSSYAKSEFHAVQFMPAIVMPQFLLCGLLVPRGHMQTLLRWASDVLPLSYAVDAMHTLSAQVSTMGTNFWNSILIVVLFLAASLILGASSLRRSAD